jgi:hypothetical protein
MEFKSVSRKEPIAVSRFGIQQFTQDFLFFQRHLNAANTDGNSKKQLELCRKIQGLLNRIENPIRFILQ